MDTMRRSGVQEEEQQMAPHPNGDQAVAEAMLTRFVDSWNEADGAAYGEGYWPDAELVDPSGAIHTGRAAIVQGHVAAWAGAFHGSRVRGDIRAVRKLGPDFLLVDLDMEVTAIRQPPLGSRVDAIGVIHAHLKHILEQRDGAWRIIAAQNTFYTPFGDHVGMLPI